MTNDIGRTYVVAEPCINCKYTDCVEVCPVDCFYEGPNFLVIHPDECIACDACVPVCPVEAIYPENKLPEEYKHYAVWNRYLADRWRAIGFQIVESKRIAIVLDDALQELERIGFPADVLERLERIKEHRFEWNVRGDRKSEKFDFSVENFREMCDKMAEVDPALRNQLLQLPEKEKELIWDHIIVNSTQQEWVNRIHDFIGEKSEQDLQDWDTGEG